MSVKSIRARLSWYLLAGTAGLLLVAGLSLDFLVRSWLVTEFDRTLAAKARAFVTLSEQEADQLEFDVAYEFMPEFSGEGDLEYFQLWADGEIVEKSESLKGHELQRDGVRSSDPRFVDFPLYDGREARQAQIDFAPQLAVPDEEMDGESLGEGGDQLLESAGNEGSEVAEEGKDEIPGLDPAELPPNSERIVATIVVAKARDDLDGTIGLFRLALGGIAIILIVALTTLIRYVVPSGLAPLHDVGRQVAELDAESLSTRIEAAKETEEIAPLVHTLNQLLDRLEEAFERERRFSSDVAHELRTPVAELKSLAEVGSRWPDDPESVRRFFEDVNEVSVNMERTIGNLLSLARCDAGIEEIVTDELKLAPTIERLCRLLTRDAEDRNVRFASEVPSDFIVQTDPAKFELIMINLLSNAIAYSPMGGTVSCVASNGSDRVTVTVTNPVHDLDQDDLATMFDRFWRKDLARTAGDHSGLGLSLVKALSELLGIDLDVALEGDGTEKMFRISLSTPLVRH